MRVPCPRPRDLAAASAATGLLPFVRMRPSAGAAGAPTGDPALTRAKRPRSAEEEFAALGRSSGAVVGALYRIPKAALGAQLGLHTRALTMQPKEPYQKAGAVAAAAASFPAYTEDAESLFVPRFYGLRHWGPTATDATDAGVPCDLRFAGSLTEVQQRGVLAYEERLASAANPMGGIVVLPCGYGKTVFALYLAARLGRRTLVLVHKAFLVEQWQARVRQFLPGASVGVVQQGRVESDADVVVGMVQSIAKRDYDEHVLAGFGLVVIDEAHHMAAPVFSRAMRKICARHTLALSATPERRDGMDDLLRWSLGDIVFRVQRDAELVHVQTLVYEARRSAICLGRDGRPVLARMLNALAEDPARNRLIAQHIADLARQGRKVIVMSDRVAQLHVLDQLFADALGGGEGEGEGEVTRGFYTGKTPPIERQAAEHKQVLFTTYAMSREALDIPALDTLVMATPVGTVEQVVGRILRKHAGKQTPLVLDVVDPYSVFDCMRWKRRRYYDKHGYERQAATLVGGAVAFA